MPLMFAYPSATTTNFLGSERSAERARKQAGCSQLLTQRQSDRRPHVRLVGVNNVYPSVLFVSEHVHSAPVKLDFPSEAPDQIDLCGRIDSLGTHRIPAKIFVSEYTLQRSE